MKIKRQKEKKGLKGSSSEVASQDKKAEEMRENAWKRERKNNVVTENVRKESVDFYVWLKE